MKNNDQIRKLKMEIGFLQQELCEPDAMEVPAIRDQIRRKIDNLRDLIDALKGACE